MPLATGEAGAIRAINLAVADGAPDWQRHNLAGIDAHWVQATSRNPTLFDGRVYVADGLSLDSDGVQATARPMRFATLTYWRHLGMPPTGFRIMFGNIILRSREGALIMARTAAHNATAGMIGFPGGTLDDEDRLSEGMDPRGCCLRECVEETGLAEAELQPHPELLVYHDAHRLAFGCIADTGLPTAALVQRIGAALSQQSLPELAELYTVWDQSDLDRLDPHVVSRAFAIWVFANV